MGHLVECEMIAFKWWPYSCRMHPPTVGHVENPPASHWAAIGSSGGQSDAGAGPPPSPHRPGHELEWPVSRLALSVIEWPSLATKRRDQLAPKVPHEIVPFLHRIRQPLIRLLFLLDEWKVFTFPCFLENRFAIEKLFAFRQELNFSLGKYWRLFISGVTGALFELNCTGARGDGQVRNWTSGFLAFK